MSDRASTLGRVLRALAAAVLPALAACATGPPVRVLVTDAPRSSGAPRILVVNAHPDDEGACAATLYKAATYLGATCDLVVITNGEGGFKYATLAERYYGAELTREDVGRARLPAIRRAELLEGARLLELREVHFLGQTDHRYTQDVAEVLGPPGRLAELLRGDATTPDVWDVPYVHAYLTRLMERERYDFVLTLAPRDTTHAHHQAAAHLAVAAASGLPEERRPVCLAVDVSEDANEPAPTTNGRALGELAPAGSGGPFVFDRTQPFGHRGRLNYQILVNLLIAQHRSQGTMQLAMNRGQLERFYLFASNPEDAGERAAALFESLKGPQFPVREYGESAGTNAAAR